MSATGRNLEGNERRGNDHYVTPWWAVHRFLEKYKPKLGATVLDPCAANGELLHAIKKVRPDLVLIAVELRPECAIHLQRLQEAGVIAEYQIESFLNLAPLIPSGAVDYIITNPPYSLSQEFVEAGERIVKVSHSYLMRVNFLGAQDRYEFTVRTGPFLWISPNRPSFTGWGGDATEYAWFTYDDETLGGNGWEMLDLTPPADIRAWNAEARTKNPKPEKAVEESPA